VQENPLPWKSSWLAQNRMPIFYAIGGVVLLLAVLVADEQFKRRRIKA
jgi:hypothetical protein